MRVQALIAIALLGIVLALPAAVAALPTKRIHPDYQLLRGDMQRYGDWVALCENNGDCTAVGFPSSDPLPTGSWAAQRYAIRLVLPNMNRVLGGHPEETPSMTLIPVGPEPDDMPALFRLGAAEAWLSGYDGSIAHGRLQLDAAASAEFRAMLDAGVTPIGIGGSRNRIVAVFPSGRFFTDMMDGIELVQSRAVRPTPESARPQHYAFAPVQLTGLLPIRTPPAACPARTPGHDLAAYALPPARARLYAVSCPETATTNIDRVENMAITRPDLTGWEQRSPAMRTWLFQSADPTATSLASSLALPDTQGRTVHAGIVGLGNVSIDFDFGVIRAIDQPEGRDDCGTLRVWGWAGSGWILLRREEMPICAGLSPGDWLIAHRRASTRAGTDE